jgi:hypothetical protein
MDQGTMDTMDTMSAEEFFAMMNGESLVPDETHDITVCSITHEPCVNPITLACGHTFEYTALVAELVNRNLINKAGRYAHATDRTHKAGFKCPYCRTVHTNTLPYFRLEGITCRAGINSPVSRQMEYQHKCGVPYKSGPNKGTPCNKVAYYHSPGATERYCSKHGPTHCITQCIPVAPQATQCQGVMIRGKNVPQGMRCMCTSTTTIKELSSHPGTHLCGVHRRAFTKRGSVDVVVDKNKVCAPHVDSGCVMKIYTESHTVSNN